MWPCETRTGATNCILVISNSFGEINVLGMVEILTCGHRYVMYRARVCARAWMRERMGAFLHGQHWLWGCGGILGNSSWQR